MTPQRLRALASTMAVEKRGGAVGGVRVRGSRARSGGSPVGLKKEKKHHSEFVLTDGQNVTSLAPLFSRQTSCLKFLMRFSVVYCFFCPVPECRANTASPTSVLAAFPPALPASLPPSTDPSCLPSTKLALFVLHSGKYLHNSETLFFFFFACENAAVETPPLLQPTPWQTAGCAAATVAAITLIITPVNPTLHPPTPSSPAVLAQLAN